MQTIQEQQVAAAIEQLRNAMVVADGATLSRLSSNSLTYGHSGGKVEGKQEFVDTIVSGRSKFLSIKLADPYIEVENDIAVARHTFLAETNDAGKRSSIKLHLLSVWRLEDGQWKMFARQAVRL